MPRRVTGTAVLLAARRRGATLEHTSRGLAHPRTSAALAGAIVILGGTEDWLDLFPRHPTRWSNTGSGRGNAREDKRLSLRMLCCSLQRKMDRTTGPCFVHLSSQGDL